MVNGSIIERTERLAAELQCYPKEEKSAWRWFELLAGWENAVTSSLQISHLLPNINIVINFLQAVSSFNQFWSQCQS